ncbi:MAG: hypothetical protein K9K67_06800 [Bacteriovoracaceae bacterium]|nr:hypothetical protein [Bacteriovoracaceae bacterium]
MSLTTQLKELVENYFLQNPHMSMNALANKSGVGATTLRRIRNDSIKGDPAPHTVLGIVSSVTNEKRLSVLIKKCEGPVGDLLKETFGPYLEEGIQHQYSDDLNSSLKDSTSYFVYKLSANRNGTDRQELQENYGRLGLKKLEDLIKAGLIEEINERLHATRKNFALDVNVVANHLPQLVSHYKPEEIAEGNNLFYTMSESLNEDGIQKIKEIKKESIKKIMNIMQSPFYEGDIAYFTLNMADTLKMPKIKGELQ